MLRTSWNRTVARTCPAISNFGCAPAPAALLAVVLVLRGPHVRLLFRSIACVVVPMIASGEERDEIQVLGRLWFGFVLPWR